MDIRNRAGHRLVAVANLSVLPGIFLYLEWNGMHEASKVAASIVAFIAILFVVVMTALEAHEGDKADNRNQARNEAG
ncbi:hypothetical protein VQH23_12160 [Pararoseomonas sp. SCSIO 73927]|uniref:hypothetical protein n=1 Tax=Pararoseomonas sp. SCSIO 73927 TaxID=3114537 RepID=UPI0030D0CE32